MIDQSSSQEGDDTSAEMFIEDLKKASDEFSAAMLTMASTEGDVREGGVFVLYDPGGNFVESWASGVLDSVDFAWFEGFAKTKCWSMHDKDVVCSGIVADADAVPPIFDGGIKLSNGWYLAFSGYRSELDRIFCMLIAHVCDLLERIRYNTIMAHGPNEANTRALFGEVVIICMMSDDDAAD